MKLLPVLLLILSVSAAQPLVTPFQQKVGELTLIPNGSELLAYQGERLIWRHQVPFGLQADTLKVIGKHLVIEGSSGLPVPRRQTLLLTLQGKRVSHTNGRFLLAEGPDFYFEDLDPVEYPLQEKRFRDIQVLHLNTEVNLREHWKVKVQGIPETCRHPLENTHMTFVKKVGERWTFQYTSENCEVIGSFQEGELKFKVEKVQNLRQSVVGPGGK